MSEEKKAKLKEYQKNYYMAKDSLSDDVNSKSSLIRFSTFLFLTSYLHSSKSIWGWYFLFTLIIDSRVIIDKHLYEELMSFYPENLYLIYLDMILFLLLCIYHLHHK